MTRRSSVMLAAALFAAGGADAATAPRPTEGQQLEKALAGLVPGKPVSCIHQSPHLDSQTYDGAILYRDGNTRYLNRFGGTCTVRANFDALIIRSYSSELCRGDSARVVETGTPIERGSCIFDSFVPYTRPK